MRDVARRKTASNTDNVALKNAVQAADRQLERLKTTAVQSFSVRHFGGLDARIKRGDQVGFVRQMKDFDLRGSKKCQSQHIAYDDRNILREADVILGGNDTLIAS